jgi:RNA polymerase sigma-70 factor (ECF subfamily)
VTEDIRASFEREVVPQLRALYNTALRLARADADARDLVQETMLRAYRTYPGFEPGTNVRAWLFTILYSVYINRYRRERREPDVLSMEDLQERFNREFHAPQVRGVPASTAVRVEAALGALPEGFREAVLLVDVEGLTYEEAAGVLTCPVGTLRSRLFRARRLLARALSDLGPRASATRGGSDA